MVKNKKKPQTAKKHTPIPFNRFHSDIPKESVEEARIRARKEADHFKKHPKRFIDEDF